uniref:GNAT family N-acetyltransferase n=1 Tax=Actinomadura sp. CA-154981 TaxID=3240037 RepID=UPI003F491BDE
MMLRNARPHEAPELAVLWRAAWLDGHTGHVPDELMKARGPEHFSVHAEKFVGSTVVATDDDKLLGLVVLAEDTGEVVQLAVDRAARGIGVGGALLRCAEERLSGRHRKAYLAVVPGNTRARRFYEFHGWRDEGPMVYRAPAAAGPVEVPVHRYTQVLG